MFTVPDFNTFLSEMAPFCKAGLVKYNLMTGIGEANDEWYTCFGIPHDASDIKIAFENSPNVHPVDNYSVRSFMHNAKLGYEKKYQGYVRVRIVDIDEDWRWTQCNIIVTKYAPKEDVVEVMLFFYDITDSVTSHSDKYKELAHMSDLLQSLNTIPWSFDFRTNILTTNREFMSHKYIFDNSIHKETYEEFLARINTEQREEVHTTCERIRMGYMARASVQCQLSFSKEKPQVWVEISIIVNELDKDGRPITAIGTTTIIQERKEAERAIHEARKKAEHANQIKTNFIANMTHEFRTPLNSILGFSTIMAHSDTIEERMQCLGAVQNSGTLLLQIIDDIIDLSQLEAREVTIRRDYVSINKIIAKAVEEARYMCKAGVDMSYFTKEDITLRGDESKIKLVLKHLLSNSSKYTSKGSIIVTAYKDSKYAYVRVADTGGGMTPETQLHMFDRFYQANTFIQGTGLGLSVVREIVNLWEGTIKVESELNVGTKITFSIPLRMNYYQPTLK